MEPADVYDVISYKEWATDYQVYINQLNMLLNEQDVYPIVHSFLAVLKEKDESKWQDTLEELAALRKKKEEVIQFVNLHTKLQTLTPKTAV